MDNLYTVLCYVVPALAGAFTVILAAQSAERLCHAYWDAKGSKEALKDVRAHADRLVAHNVELDKLVSRYKSENDKLKQIPVVRPRL